MAALNNLMAKLTPRQKQFGAIGLAVAALIGTIYLSLDNKEGAPEERYDPKTDQRTVNVITNDSNKNLGMDALAGRLRVLDEQNQRLRKQVESLASQRQADRADKTQQREWQEKFDALTSEVNKLRAQQRDANTNIRMSSTGTVTRNAAGDAQIDDPFQVREQRRREMRNEGEGEPQAETQKGGSGNQPAGEARGEEDPLAGAKKSTRRGPLKINVVSDPEVAERERAAAAAAAAMRKAAEPKDPRAYIPAGSIITGTMVTGADFPTGKNSRDNPTPSLVRLSKTAILPNRYSSDVRECFMLVSGHGDLATERALLRSEMLSCIRTDGSVIETKVNGYVSGEDGKTGIKGRLVSKTGQMIARTLVAGFLSGMSEAFDYDPVEVLDTSGTSNHVKYQSRFHVDAAKGGLAQGAHKALERVADYYMDLADQMTPVVEITAGRQIDLIVINGTELNVLPSTKENQFAERSQTPTQAPQPASGASQGANQNARRR